MPDYRYLCHECGQTWEETHDVDDRRNATCPSCETHGSESSQQQDGSYKLKIEILPPERLNIRTRDTVEREGGLKDGGVRMPSLGIRNPHTGEGETVVVRTERERQEHLRRTREKHFAMTDGPHTVLKPFKDDRGRVTLEPVTTVKKGVDLGELVDVRELHTDVKTTDELIAQADKKVAGEIPVVIPRKLAEKKIYVGAPVEGGS